MPKKEEVVAFYRRLGQGHPRIKGTLGGESKIDPDASAADRLRQRHASMTDGEVAEVMNRLADFYEDCCECGGSIKHGEHAEGCPHAG